VSECRMDLDERRGTIEIRGTKANRQRARDYVNFIDQQRQGSVTVDIDGRGDLTVVEVPEDCCGFVMGRGGNTLRSMEEEWGTLMCFATVDGREKLCIFGKFKARRGAELKVMSALEHKRPGHCVDRDEILFSKRVKGDKLAAAAGACLASLIGFAAAYCASLPSHRIHRLRRLRD
jgi:hypothetical protein